MEQAKKLATRLSCEFRVVKIVSSNLLRAKQTADIIAESLGGASITAMPLLRERSMGNLRGRVYDDVLSETGLQTIYDPSNVTIEGTASFETRVRSAWKDVLSISANIASGEAVAVVSHGMVLRLILQNYVQSGVSRDVKNTSLTVLDVNTLQVVRGVANCTKHLEA